MTLQDYLSAKHILASHFADRIGVSVSTITRLLPSDGKKQTRRPGWDLIEKIAAATDGAVTANDFMPEAGAGERHEAAE